MAGYKTWNDLDILTAADLNGYLMQQAVPRFASTAARDAALTTAAEGALAYVTGVGLFESTGSGWTLLPPPAVVQTLATAAASVTFSGISQLYRTLELHVQARGDAAAQFASVGVQFNADTTSVYDHQQLEAFGATAQGFETLNASSISVGEIPAATTLTGQSGIMVVNIPFYTGTTFWKYLTSDHALSMQTTGGQAGNHFSKQWAGRWRNTSAINSVKFVLSAGNFVAGSAFALFGRP